MTDDTVPEDHPDDEDPKPTPPILPPRDDAEQAQDDADEVPTP